MVGRYTDNKFYSEYQMRLGKRLIRMIECKNWEPKAAEETAVVP